MPGAYAHIAAAKYLSSSDHLDETSLSNPFKYAVSVHSPYVILGSVSPDYPYLHLGSSSSAEWADLMHLENVGSFFHNAVSLIKQVPEDDGQQARCIAWLLGYASHVGMDMTIHPIVERKVGVYAENKMDHRICEMNQDVHIWQRMNLGTIGRGETIDLLRLCSGNTSDTLNAAVNSYWNAILKQTHPADWEANPPAIDTWHKMFSEIVDRIEESYRVPKFARHVAANTGISYPLPEEVDKQYIQDLETPQGTTMNYDKIFDFALSNVARIWEWIASDIQEGTDYTKRITSWCLDNGKDETDACVLWS